MNDRFVPIFITVVALTIFCGAIAIGIAILAPDPASSFLDRIFDASIGLFTLGVGTIIIGLFNWPPDPPATRKTK